MQVADMQNKSTSASLGAGETLAVSMVEDAAFLMMLSSNQCCLQKLPAKLLECSQSLWRLLVFNVCWFKQLLILWH